MRLIIDADACPVTRIAVEIAKKQSVHVILVCDTSHEMNIADVTVLTVSRGADSADYRIVNLLIPGDIVVTQDYGLAAMCLGRNARCLNQDGMEYTAENIDLLLLRRHEARKVRMAGGRTKGPKKRQSTQDDTFCAALERLLRE